jgi:transposase InsO family protein
MEHRIVVKEVISIRDSHRAMGTRKLYEKIRPFLEEHRIKMGRDSLFDLLSEHELLIKKRKRRISTTMSYHRFHKWPNLIRDFVPDMPNQLYVSDITYWKIGLGHVYISLVTDAYSHKIVGSHVSETLEAAGCRHALEQALLALLDGATSLLTHHSDRGIQYCSSEYVKLLQDNNVKISMTENSEPTENAIAERINGILKNEYLAFCHVDNITQAREQLNKAVELYNHERPHMSIGNLTPEYVHQSKTKTEKLWKNYYRKPKDVNLF